MSRIERDREQRRLEQEDRRERERIEAEARREEERLAKEERLLTTLRATQPVMPQRVTVSSNRLPSMREGDDIESFLPQLRGAMVALNVPKDEWKGYIYSQVTTSAKEPVMNLLSDPEATYDEVEQGLLGVAGMSFANAAEAIFSPMTVERSKQSSMSLLKQLTRWMEKLTGGRNMQGGHRTDCYNVPKIQVDTRVQNLHGSDRGEQ